MYANRFLAAIAAQGGLSVGVVGTKQRRFGQAVSPADVFSLMRDVMLR